MLYNSQDERSLLISLLGKAKKDRELALIQYRGQVEPLRLPAPLWGELYRIARQQGCCVDIDDHGVVYFKVFIQAN